MNENTGWVIRLAQEKFGPGFVSRFDHRLGAYRTLYPTGAQVFQDPQEAAEMMTSRGFQPQDFEVVKK